MTALAGRVWTVWACLSALCLLALTAPASASDADRQAIEQSAQEWVAAYEAQDLDRLLTHYEPNVLVALNNQPAMWGDAAVRAYFQAAFQRARARMALKIEDIQVYGDRAHLVSLFRMEGTRTADGAPFTAVGRSLLIYARGQDGRWRILADMDNTTPDAAVMKAQ